MRTLLRPIPERLETLSVLDPVSRPLQRVVRRIVRDGTPIKDLLSGTWLGHPLHPLLTDVVIGAWTSAWFLDLLPTRKTREASDTLIGIGVLAALPTAAAGLTDWSDVGDRERRVGTVHALANLSALTLYTLSYVNRRRGRRARGWAQSTLGAGAVTFAGLLGGHLTYGRGVGVDQTAFDTGPTRWTATLQEVELSDGKLVRAHANDTPIVLFRRDDRILALSDRCAHRGCPLSAGEVDADLNVTCSCHGSTYSLEDGHIVRGPTTAPQPAYETRVRDGEVEVRRRS